MKSPYLTIREFSSLTRTPIDTLKHYDRIGLLKPARRNEKNNYRYYLPEQSLTLTRIIFGSRAKVSLKDIQSFIHEKDTDKVIAKYKYIASNLTSHTNETNSISNTIANLCYYYSLTRRFKERLLFSIYLPEWFMIYSRPSDTHCHYESHSLDVANQLFIKGFAGDPWPHYLLGAFFTENDKESLDFSKPAFFLKVDHPERYKKEDLVFVDAGYYTCLWLKSGGKHLSASMKTFMTTLYAGRKEICGPIFAMDIVNSLITSDSSKYCTMIYARIKEMP